MNNEKFFYIPDLCSKCHKLNPKNILVTNGKYKAAYNDYKEIQKSLPYIKNVSGGMSLFPIKLFIRNGYYK